MKGEARNEFNKFNDTVARMLDSIYHMMTAKELISEINQYLKLHASRLLSTVFNFINTYMYIRCIYIVSVILTAFML